MDFDDLEPRQKPKAPKPLDRHSVEELNDYIAALEAEIERARAEIAKKQGHRSTAEAFFKS